MLGCKGAQEECPEAASCSESTQEVVRGLGQVILNAKLSGSEQNAEHLVELEEALERLPQLPDPPMEAQDVKFWLQWAEWRLDLLRAEV